jgi:small-conductance mechanosensitive channel
MNTDTKTDTAVAEVQESPDTVQKSDHIKQADCFRNLLLGISIILVAGTAIFQLDLMPSVVLGCGVVGFNYYWTVKFVQKLLLERKLFALDLLFILTKFAISVIVLFGALTYLKLPPMGLLIGLSNVALAAIVYSFVRVMNPHKFA